MIETRTEVPTGLIAVTLPTSTPRTLTFAPALRLVVLAKVAHNALISDQGVQRLVAIEIRKACA